MAYCNIVLMLGGVIMSDWLRRLADWVDDMEWRARSQWRRWFPAPEPPPFIGPLPTVDFLWRQIRADVSRAFEWENDEWEWFNSTEVPNDTGR